MMYRVALAFLLFCLPLVSVADSAPLDKFLVEAESIPRDFAIAQWELDRAITLLHSDEPNVSAPVRGAVGKARVAFFNLSLIARILELRFKEIALHSQGCDRSRSISTVADGVDRRMVALLEQIKRDREDVKGSVKALYFTVIDLTGYFARLLNDAVLLTPPTSAQVPTIQNLFKALTALLSQGIERHRNHPTEGDRSIDYLRSTTFGGIGSGEDGLYPLTGKSAHAYEAELLATLAKELQALVATRNGHSDQTAIYGGACGIMTVEGG